MKLFKNMNPSALLEAYLTWLLYFILYTAIIIVPIVSIMFFYPPFIIESMIMIAGIICLISFYTNRIFVRILKEYKQGVKKDLYYYEFNTAIVLIITIIIEVIIYTSNF